MAEVVSTRFTWRTPVRVAPRKPESVDVFVDSWDPNVPISYPVQSLPDGVVQRLSTGVSFVVAEALVDLAATDASRVLGDVVKILQVPEDGALVETTVADDKSSVFWIAFDPQTQSVHLDRCSCSNLSEYDFPLGKVDSLSRDEIDIVIEDDGGPSEFQVAPCILAARKD